MRTLLLLVISLPLMASDPVRALIVTRHSDIVRQAFQRFEQTYGKDLLDLQISEYQPDPAAVRDAQATFFYFLAADAFIKTSTAAKAAVAHGATLLAVPRDNADRHWPIKIDDKLNQTAERYWSYGGVENVTAFLAFLYRSAGGAKPLEVPVPLPQSTAGIYHPDSLKSFTSLPEYLAWYRSRKLVPENAPLAGILFYANNYKFKDLAHIDALVRQLEKEGIGAVPVFGYPLNSLRPFLTIEDQTPLRLLFAFSLGFSKPEDATELESYGVHVIDLMTTRWTEAEWNKSVHGIEPSRIGVMLNGPERVGATEPILVATTEKVAGGSTARTQPVPERIDAAVRRGRRWLILQDKSNREKRIGFIYYSNPPGKGYLGASYLNAVPSMIAILHRLHEEGYQVGAEIPSERQLIDVLHRSGRNIEQWAPGEVEEMAAKGGIALVSMRKYKSWFAELPREFREFVISTWGPPEMSSLMTITARTGEKFFLVPGVRYGNVFLGPQPLRTTFDRATDVQHDTVTPPPHSYIAAYLWYRREFRADALVHMGRHGTLEWLPGKHVGQAGWDTSEVLLGDVPDPYYFIIDGGGEAIQARRRSAGVMIGHLTPMIVPGGAQPEFQALHSALENYAKFEDTSQPLADEYKREILEQVAELKIEKQLGIDVVHSPWEQTHDAIHKFVQSIESGPLPMGMHTIGSAPRDDVQQEALEEFIRSNFQPAERRQLAGWFAKWANGLFHSDKTGATIDAPHDLAPHLRDKIETTLAGASEWLANLRKSPAMELSALVTVLNGRYLVSGLLGDPLHNPASLPSGRNLHDFDTALIPTRAAWELGKRMAGETVSRYRKEKGAYPDKVSMVLWYGETGRSQGAMESEAFALMGVEPQWNARGVVDGLKLIPDKELGRPRVDVVFTISGIYRDGFGDKLLLLDKAARLVAGAGDNAISRHDREISDALKHAGVKAETAEKAARARVFSAAPGSYGVGIEQIVQRSKDEGKEKGLADMYLHHMNYAYSADLWGENVPQALAQQLRGNQAVIHSRTTYVYGVLDNDDFYQFAGGLNAASKAINQEVPQFYVNNLRARGQESVEDFRTFLVKELNTRYWNPKWIKEMQNSGYAGARQFIKEMEHLYGWQATSKEHVDGSLWQKSFDVYVADKHGLKMDEFFEQANPYVRQWQLARLLEIDRQGSYRFSEQDRSLLVRKYVASVAAHGIACSANTCGNLRLNQWIAGEAPLVSGLGTQELRAFGRQLAAATHWKARQFAMAPPAVRAGMQPPQLEKAARVASAAKHPPASANTIVSGFRMQERPVNPSAGLIAPHWFSAALLIVFLILLTGAAREVLRV